MTGIAFGIVVGLGYVAVLATGLEAAVSLGGASSRADIVVGRAGALANAAVVGVDISVKLQVEKT